MARWTGFEAAFDGFDPRKIALWSEEDIDRLSLTVISRTLALSIGPDMAD